jgi:predicted nucleic acid-binding protein
MYLLDANVFIEAYRRYYSFEVVPAFWEWLDQAHTDGRVASVRKVFEELTGRGDDLSAWAGARRPFFLDEDEKVLSSLTAAATWATSNSYRASAVSDFLESGDYFLIGHAHAHGHTVVTHERPAPDAVKSIKIPDVCGGLSVPYINAHTMLQREGARFVLG